MYVPFPTPPNVHALHLQIRLQPSMRDHESQQNGQKIQKQRILACAMPS